MQVTVMRTDGTSEVHEIPRVKQMDQIAKLINADTLDTVRLHNGYVLLVNDNGWETKTVQHGQGHVELVPQRNLLPINDEATELYHSVCRPGTTHKIAGDAAVARDEDFA